jgi:hypothetical protein
VHLVGFYCHNIEYDLTGNESKFVTYAVDNNLTANQKYAASDDLNKL